ncbi:MAG: ATP-binding protein, partial [Acidobacteriota bacterium]
FRSTLGLIALISIALVLFVASIFEARQQRETVARALFTQANLLAKSLGPGLVAASNAALELDELIVWKLLDNARLLSRLHQLGQGDEEDLAAIADSNGLDSIVIFDEGGSIIRSHGELPPEQIDEALEDVIDGDIDELILGSTMEDGIEHIGVAVGTGQGGAVLVRIHASTARTFAKRLGVRNLLENLVGTEGVLYLGYYETPGGPSIEVSWNDLPLPVDSGEGNELESFGGRPVYSVDVPLESPAGRAVNLRVGLDGEPLEQAAAAAMRRLLAMGLILTALTVAAVAAALISRSRAAEREMAARRLAEAETARRRSERLAAAGALTAGLAHEVRSPMNAIGLAAQRLERRLEASADQEIAQRIRQEIQRLEGTLREFLVLASPVSDERKVVDLAVLAREVVDLLADEATAEGIRLSIEGSAAAEVDPQAVRRVLINLVRNAIQASSAGGEVSIRARVEATATVVEVTDVGSGVDPELGDRIFDAFVSGRESGVGLGLALVKRVMEEHDGSVELRNRSVAGAMATIRFPLSQEARV